jgi:hypothetical protein
MAICLSSYSTENYAIVNETGVICLSGNEVGDTFKFESVSSLCFPVMGEYVKKQVFSRLAKTSILGFMNQFSLLNLIYKRNSLGI